MVQVPDARNGWHTPSLREALRGPGQLLGPVRLDTHGYSDVWSNDISDTAIQARAREDAAEAAAWEATKAAKGWTHGLPADATEQDRSDFAIGTRREKARDARVYQGGLTKRGSGTLYLTGTDTWHGTSTVLGGGLSVVGSHAASVDVRGGTLGGTGSVGGGVDVAEGVLRPGVAPGEQAAVAPGDVLNVGGDVRIGRAGSLAVTVSGDGRSTSVRAAGDLVLRGSLRLAVHGPLTRGSVLTVMSGRSVGGAFRGLPEGGVAHADGHWFRVSYRHGGVTLTVLR
jgi:subtilase-type serine protease